MHDTNALPVSLCTLVPPDQLRLLNQRSNLRGMIHLIGHLALIAATITGVRLAQSGPWLLLAMLALGITQVATFAALHECIHRSAFRSLWLNQVVCWGAGLLLMLPPTWFTQFHQAHHRYTQNPARDPELSIPKPQNLSQYLWIVSGIPYWRNAVWGLLVQAVGRLDGMDYLSQRACRKVVQEARIFLAVYATTALAAVIADSLIPLIYWLAPVLLGQPFLRLYLLPEHTGCRQSNDRLANTRTILASAPVRWLCWNGSYHAEHHLYPGIPFYALPMLHREVCTQLQVVAQGYPAAHRSICQAF